MLWCEANSLPANIAEHMKNNGIGKMMIGIVKPAGIFAGKLHITVAI